MKLTVTSDGTVKFIYDDELRPLIDDGPAEVKRASHVEPDKNGKWRVDLRDVGGPIFGGFLLRKDALLAEIVWIERNVL